MTTFIRPGIDYAAFDAYLTALYDAQAAREQQDADAQRRTELEAHVTETGLPLPLPANVIVQLEDAGAVVDLETGWITWPSGIRTAPVDSVILVGTKEKA
jgi:hypothetical protein